MDSGGLWGLLTIIGPILLAAVILWAIFHNRGTPAEVQRTEDATRQLYDDQNEIDRLRDGK